MPVDHLSTDSRISLSVLVAELKEYKTMKHPSPRFQFLRNVNRTVLIEKVSLFGAMYVVTVSLFWFETGMLSKGLVFGVIAASLKTAIAQGHSKIFRPKCEPPVSLVCDQCDQQPEVPQFRPHAATISPVLKWGSSQPCGS